MFHDERVSDTKAKVFFAGSQQFSYFAVDLESVISYESHGGESPPYCMSSLSCDLTMFSVACRDDSWDCNSEAAERCCLLVSGKRDPLLDRLVTPQFHTFR